MALFKHLVRRIPGLTGLHSYLSRLRHTPLLRPEPYPRGHYYSPLPDLDEVRSKAATLFNPDVDLGPSIDLRADAQRSLLGDLAQLYDGFPWNQKPLEEYRFHLDQTHFRYGDALILYSILRFLKPQRVIEVGSGFSSALMLDTNDSFLDGTVRFTFIEPFPARLEALLRKKVLPQNLWVDRDMLGLCPKPQGFLRHGSGVPRVDERAPLRLGNGAGALDAPSAWLSLARLRPRRARLRFAKRRDRIRRVPLVSSREA